MKNAKQIDIIKDLNIDFSKINQFILVYMNDFFCFNGKSERKDPILNSIYSLANTPKNLQVLDLYFDKHYSIVDLFFPKWFNSFINLKELKVRGLDFNSKLIINLPKLEIIKLHSCYNIDFLHETVDKKLKYLELFNTSLKSIKQHIFENLEELKINQSKNYNIEIDFSFLKKLKKYSANNFSLVEKIPLFPLLEEFTYIPNIKDDNGSNDGKIFNLFISNKTLNKVNIEFRNLKYDDLKTSIINNNIKDIYLIKDSNIDYDYNIEFFLKKFSYIKKLKLETKNYFPENFYMSEDKKIIIEELELPTPSIPIFFSFSHLKSLSIDFPGSDYMSYICFSLFSSDCTTKFYNLENLNISISKEPFDSSFLKNLANNIQCCKNLKNFIFKFYTDAEDIKEKKYFDFIDKLLSLNLVKINISFDINGWNEFYKVRFKFYTRSELKKIFQNKIKDDSKYIYKIQRVKTKKEKKAEGKNNEKCLIS